MKKLIGLFLCMSLCLFTSVSFASDGPKTTKDCVIGMDVTMEVASQINEGLNVSYEAVVNESNCSNCFTNYSEMNVSIVAIVIADVKTENAPTNILEDPGVDNGYILNNYNLFELNYLYRPSLS